MTLIMIPSAIERNAGLGTSITAESEIRTVAPENRTAFPAVSIAIVTAEAASAGAPNVDLQTDTTDWNTSYFYGAGGMVSTLADLGAWADIELGTNLLSSRSAGERLTMHDIGGDGFLYGLGIKQFGNWYGHDGDAFGWDSLALHDPTTDVSYVAAVNSCTDYNDALLDLIQHAVPGRADSLLEISPTLADGSSRI